MTTKKSPEPMECQVEGCGNVARKKGVCLQHLAENYIGGCTVEGCEQELFAKGRCKVHYMRRFRKKAGKKRLLPDDAPIRAYGQGACDVFTRVPKWAMDIIVGEAGSKKDAYGKMQEILVNWAQQHQPAAR